MKEKHEKNKKKHPNEVRVLILATNEHCLLVVLVVPVDYWLTCLLNVSRMERSLLRGSGHSQWCS